VTVESRGLTKREATYLLRRDLIGRANFTRSIRAVSADVVTAAEIARQLGDVFSATEIRYLTTLPPHAFRWLPEIDGGNVRVWGPSGPVGHREPDQRVTRATVALTAAALEEDLLDVLPRELIPDRRPNRPATIAAAVYKTPAAVRQAVRRTLLAIGLDGIARSGVRHARWSDDAGPTGDTEIERNAWQARHAKRDAESARTRRRRSAERNTAFPQGSAWERATDEQRTAAYRRERLQRTAWRKLRAGIIDSEVYVRIAERLMVEPAR